MRIHRTRGRIPEPSLRGIVHEHRRVIPTTRRADPRTLSRSDPDPRITGGVLQPADIRSDARHPRPGTDLCPRPTAAPPERRERRPQFTNRSQPAPRSSTERRSARSKNRLIGFIVAIAQATGADSKFLSTLSAAQGRGASSDAAEKNRMPPCSPAATGLTRLGAVHINSGKGLARKTPDAFTNTVQAAHQIVPLPEKLT
jgi:hypothetical protein